MDYGRTTFHAVTEEQNFKTKGEHNIKSSMWLQNKLLLGFKRKKYYMDYGVRQWCDSMTQ